VTIYLQGFDLLLPLLAAVLIIALLAFIWSARHRYKQRQRQAKIAAREWVEAQKVRDEIDLMYWRASQEVKRLT
jgi:hypothetical protein